MQSPQQRRKNAIRLYEVAIKAWEVILSAIRPGSINEASAKTHAQSKIKNLQKHVNFTKAKLQYE